MSRCALFAGSAPAPSASDQCQALHQGWALACGRAKCVTPHATLSASDLNTLNLHVHGRAPVRGMVSALGH